jgi:molybdopterin converting factor small subunit
VSVEVNTRVRVLFFGKVGEVIGHELEIDLPEAGCTVRELRSRISGLAGADVLLKPGVRASVDKQVAGEDAWVGPGAEVAFFSVFSGG